MLRRWVNKETRRGPFIEGGGGRERAIIGCSKVDKPLPKGGLGGGGEGNGGGPNSPAMITPMRKGNIGQEAGICERCNNEKATHQTMDVYSPLSITLLYTLFNAHRICFRGVFNALYDWSWGRGDGNRWRGLKVPPWYEGTHVRVVREHFISDEFAKQEGQLCKTWMCLVVLVTTICKTMEQSHYNQLGTIKNRV